MKSKVVYIQDSTDEAFPASNIMIVTDTAEKGIVTTCWTASGSYEAVSLGEIVHSDENELKDKANLIIAEMKL